MPTLAEIHRRNAAFFPDRLAFAFGDERVTFGDYDRRTSRLAAALAARGVAPGDRIAVLARNCLEFLDVLGAAEKAGFVFAPLNFRLGSREIAPVLANIDPAAVFAQPVLADVVDEAGAAGVPLRVAMGGDGPDGWLSWDGLHAGAPDQPPRFDPAPGDLAYLMSTSGTTGTPRSAQLTHEGQWLDAMALAFEMRLEPGDRHLATMPLFHVGGRALVLAHTLRGCGVVLHDGFDARAVTDEIERSRITTTQVVPPMVSWLLDDAADADLSSLRLIWYASAPMPAELLRRGLERFGPIFIQGYGQTESGPLATTLLPEEHVLEGPEAELLQSCGRAIPGVDVRIVDDRGREVPRGETGEIVIRGPLNMTGYWRDPEATAEALRDGWLHTGDMGRMGERGHVFIVDRRRDMIITGGENVFSREVEEIIHAHPRVAETAVIGVPDSVWGEAVKAIVVWRPGEEGDEAELIAFCRERLAAYKCPKSVEERDALPKSPTGKVLKRELRAPYWQREHERA